MKTLTINNNIEEIAALAPFIDDVVEEYGLTPDVGYQLNLVLDEAMANSVCYAYPEGETGTVTVEVEKENDIITLRLIDEGVPFDPTQKGDDVNVDLSVEERPIGGLGIFLIKQMMDEVSYERIDDRNMLVMKKILQST